MATVRAFETLWPVLGSRAWLYRPPSQASGTLIRTQSRGCWSPPPHLPSSQIRNCCVERSRLVIRKSKGLGSILRPRQVPHLRGYSLSQSGTSCLLGLPEEDEMIVLEGWRPRVFFSKPHCCFHPPSLGDERLRACAYLVFIPCTVHRAVSSV